MTFEELRKLEGFGRGVMEFLDELGILKKTKGLTADHVGVRLKEVEDVEMMKHELEKVSECISSAIVGGREILIYKMHTPLAMDPWSVECVELPYPKPTHSYDDGWEHVEFVIPSQAMDMDTLRTDFVKFFSEIDIEALKAKSIYAEEVPHADEEQLPNPSIALCKNKMLSHSCPVKNPKISNGFPAKPFFHNFAPHDLK